MKVAWEAIDPETIAKCFRCSGIQDNYDSPPSTPEPIDDDPEFADYFEKVLNIPWDKYLAMDEELESKEPTRAPNTGSYTNDNNNDEICPDEVVPQVKSDEALEWPHKSLILVTLSYWTF